MDKEEKDKCCCGLVSDVEGRIKERSDDEKKKLVNRLNRIEGQIRGVKNICFCLRSSTTSANAH